MKYLDIIQTLINKNFDIYFHIFIIKLLSIWNEVPLNIKSIKSLETFFGKEQDKFSIIASKYIAEIVLPIYTAFLRYLIKYYELEDILIIRRRKYEVLLQFNKDYANNHFDPLVGTLGYFISNKKIQYADCFPVVYLLNELNLDEYTDRKIGLLEIHTGNARHTNFIEHFKNTVNSIAFIKKIHFKTI